MARIGWWAAFLIAAAHVAAQMALLPLATAVISGAAPLDRHHLLAGAGVVLLFPLPLSLIASGTRDNWFLVSVIVLNGLLWGFALAGLATLCGLLPTRQQQRRYELEDFEEQDQPPDYDDQPRWPPWVRWMLRVALLGMIPLLGFEADRGFFGLSDSLRRSFTAPGPDFGDAQMPQVARMTNLRQLQLAGTKVTDTGLEYLRPLIRLNKLDLSNTKVNGRGFRNLRAMSHLEDLQLNHTDTGARGLEQIGELTGLATLSLADTQVDDAALAQFQFLPRLTTLVLSNSKVTDAGLAHLQSLRQLRKLDVRNTRVTATGVRQFHAALPECEISH